MSFNYSLDANFNVSKKEPHGEYSIILYLISYNNDLTIKIVCKIYDTF